MTEPMTGTGHHPSPADPCADPAAQAPMDWSALFPATAGAVRVVLHAPTAGALARARSNLANLRQDMPQAEVWIIVNGPAVEALLDAAPGTAQQFDPVSLARTLVCPNTLRKLGRGPGAGMQVLPQGGIESLVLLQRDGWSYVRC